MASAGDATCANDPNFAIICSFFQKFSPMLNIQQPDIHLLQEWLENTDEVQPGLRELHVKLLRKMRKTVHETAWESALVKFCYLYSSQDAWEVERFGYKKSSLKVKLRILTAILEFQFQLNGKFRNKFSNLSAEELRSEPIGRDNLGHSYWLTQDPSCNFRIYQEHLDEEIWQVVASNRSEMETLISRLKGNEVVLPSLIGVIDEDSSSNSCPNAVIKPPPPEEQDDSQSSANSNTKAKVPNIKIKLESGKIANGNGHFKNGKGAPKVQSDDDDEDADGEEEDDEEEEEEGDDGEGDNDIEDEDEEEEKVKVASSKEVPKALATKDIEKIATIKGAEKSATTKDLEKVTVTKEVEKADKKLIENGKSESDDTGSDKRYSIRRVKPLVISQSKVTAISEEKPITKKRPLEDDDREPETERIVKKSRPTLLDNRREKKSKYEKYSEEDDDDEDDVGEEEEEEGEEEEDEEVPNEEETGEEDDEVGEEIEEEVLIVKGEGSGKDCEGSFLDEIQIGCEENDDPVGEEIEEEIIYVYGEGSGKQCLVGNPKEETGKSTFFFGQPGCLKLSPIKKNVDANLNKADLDTANDKTAGQKNGEIESKNDNSIPGEKSVEGDVREETKITKENEKDVEEKKDNNEKEMEISENKKEEHALDQVHVEAKADDKPEANKPVDEKDAAETMKSEPVDLPSKKNVKSCEKPEVESKIAKNTPEHLKISEEPKEKIQKLGKCDNKTSITRQLTEKKETPEKSIILPLTKVVAENKKPKEEESQLEVNKIVVAAELSKESTRKSERKSEKRESREPSQEKCLKQAKEKEVPSKNVKEEDNVTEQTKETLIATDKSKACGVVSELKTRVRATEDSKEVKHEHVPEKSPDQSETALAEKSKKQEKLPSGDNTVNKSNPLEPSASNIVEKKEKSPPPTKKILKRSAKLEVKEFVTKPQNKVQSSTTASEAIKLIKTVEIKTVQCKSQETIELSTKLPEITEVSTKCKIKVGLEKNTVVEARTVNTRKRRFSEEKVRPTSESDSDLNSDSVAPPTEEDEDIGGKRPKMRLKSVNTELRKKVEECRKSSEKHESTSEDEYPNECSLEVVKKTKEKVDEVSSPAPVLEPAIILEAIQNLEPAPVLDQVVTQVSVQTRATRRNPAGTSVKVSPPKSRARKKANPPPPVVKKEEKPPEIPSLKAEIPTEINLKAEEPSVLDEMPKLEPEANGSKQSTPAKSTTPRNRKREIDTSNIIDVDSETPVRQSRRIAQLKIREEAERRKLEEVALKKMKAELKKKKKEEHKTTTQEYVLPSEPSADDTEVDSEAELSNKKIISKKKLRGLKGKEGRWSSGPEDEPEEDEEYDMPNERYDTDPGSPLFRSDHEFSPESDIEDESQAVPLKRARTVRKEGAELDAADSLDESCQKCGKKDHPEWILLCDKCDKGYHCSCLSPVLFIIPEGDWFCPLCQQGQLIEALEKQMQDLDDLVKQKRIKEEEDIRAKNVALAQKLKDEEEEAKEKEIVRTKKTREERVKKRRKPRVRKAFVVDDEEASSDSSDNDRSSRSTSGNSSSSGSGSGSGSSSASGSDDEPIYKLRKRRQVNVSYRFNEYDDLINSAIKHEMDEVAGAGNLGRGKDISTIIEADKEEKMRQKMDTIRESDEEAEVVNAEEQEPVVKEEKEEKPAAPETPAENDSGSDFEPMKRKSKLMTKNLKKKSRKLNNLDISSDDDGSDEDFKTSSYETEEDESISGQTDSDSSLEVYRRRGKKNKKGKRPTRRAARERRRLDADFVVDDSDVSDEAPRKKKTKRKYDWELRDSGSEEELSEQIDSEDLCDDTTDSEDSDGAWRPSRRKKTKIIVPKQKQSLPLHGKQPKIRKKEIAPSEKTMTIKPQPISKGKHETDESDEDVPRTRGKRFTYLEDFEDDSSDDGIKPGVKRPDTPPEEREKFIKKQEEIKRMLAEKNTEAAKAAATPTLTPLSKPGATDSLSTVPLSVIKGAKVLDMDYLQRKGELNSDDPDTDFDEDLPDDFDPEDMDEEEIAKMMEEEDFAQQQLKLAGEAIRQKKIKDMEQVQRIEPPQPVHSRHQSTLQTQEPPRKRLPMPTIQPLFSNTPRFLPPHHRIAYDSPIRHSVHPSMLPSVQSLQSRSFGAASHLTSSSSNVQTPSTITQESGNEPVKPRGRRKKITPLRDTLQKQQAAAAAAAAAASSVPPTAKEIPSLSDKPPAGSKLSVAQPPQLYTPPPTSTPPSVITRLPQPPRPRFTEQSSRFYPPANQLAHRPSLIRHGGPMPPHHTLRPSFASGPPPLRPANPRLPISIGNGITRQPSPRQMAPFAGAEQYTARSPHPAPPPHAYRPPLYGNPGFPPAPPQHSPTPIHPAASDYTASTYGPTPSYGPYYPPPQNIGPTHSTPPPPVASAIPVPVPPSSVIAPILPANSPPPAIVAVAETSLPPAPTRPKATALETFDSKSTPPLLETETTNSPYCNTAPVDDNDGDDNEAECPPSNTTSEFSGLVSYFSSQHDDLNT